MKITIESSGDWQRALAKAGAPTLLRRGYGGQAVMLLAQSRTVTAGLWCWGKLLRDFLRKVEELRPVLEVG